MTRSEPRLDGPGGEPGPRGETLLDPAGVRSQILRDIRPLPPAIVPVAEAGGLVLAEPLTAPYDLPSFPNAAMDGFAVRSGDQDTGRARLRIVGRAFAGRPSPATVGPGEAVAIATGAMLPGGADAVVAVEDAETDGEWVLLRVPERGRHVRMAGEDLAAGTIAVPSGMVVGPGQLAAAAALGIADLVVQPRPRVAILPTGDEVRPPGVPLGSGQVRDAVSLPLAWMLEELGARPSVLLPAPDEPASLAQAVLGAADEADAVITIGGVSRGERDLIRSLASAGTVTGYRLALQPAKPFAFGLIGRGSVPLFGLPGNPAAALAAFEELVRPAILALLGKPAVVRPSVPATLTEPISHRLGRLHLVRVRLWRDGDRLMATSAGDQGAGMIHSLARANAWACVPADVAELPAGAQVQVRPLTDLP